MALAWRNLRPATGWPLHAFLEVASIDEGLVSPLAPPFCDLPHLGPENIESRTGRIVGPLRTAADLGLKSGKSVFDPKSIVYCKVRPGLNKVATPEFRGLSSADAYVVRPRDGVVRRAFLAYAMRASGFVQQALRVSMRTGMPKINRGELAKLRIPVPPLEQQVFIEDILGVFDGAVNLLHALAGGHRRFKSGLMQELLTGKRRFKEFERAPRRAVRVGEIACEVTERAGEKQQHLPVVSCSKHEGLVDSLHFFGKQVFSVDRANYRVVRRGQFTYPSNHVEEGSIGLLQHHDAALVSPIYTVFQAAPHVVPEYLYLLFKNDTYRQLFAKNTNGSVNRRGSLRWKQFRVLPVPLPPFDEQMRIAALAGLLEREITCLESLREALDRQQRGVADLLLTGKVHVPEAVS